MNKYIKLLTLSGSVLGAVGLTAITPNIDNTNKDIGGIYANITKMQNAIPKLSSINRLNIELTNDTLSDTSNGVNVDASADNTTNDNISFATTDENGQQVNLTKEDSLEYLNETLNQTNMEYENLKNTLKQAIQDTMEYLDKYKNGEIELTNEQKIYIKEHSNSIKFLAETLEDLSEDIICCIDGNCNECDDDTIGDYIKTIGDLETRIYTLQNAISSLQFINNLSNPYFNSGVYAYGNMYNLHPNYNDQSNSQDNEDNNSGSTEADTTNNVNSETDSNSVTNNTENNVSSIEVDEQTETADDKPTTFGLKSNIDTYAPTNRNIDTFFNTALLDKNYYGGGYGGYGMPYGYSGGYGYMNGAYQFNNPYNEINSNLINRNQIEQNNQTNPVNSVANIENNDTNTKPAKKRRIKRAKNVDTYKGATIKSNINTMGESKISQFFKDKFNNLRNKVRKQKNSQQYNNKNTETRDIVEDEIIEYNKETDLNSLKQNNIDNQVDSLKQSADDDLDFQRMQQIQNNSENTMHELKRNPEIKAK